MRAPAVLFLILCALGTLAGCAAKDSGSGRTYTTRGQVIQLPDPANPGTGLTLNHEAIDQFVDRQGELVGMDPMSMPFPVAKGVSLEGIQVSDIVELKLHVDWSAEPAAEITEIRELPAGTKLDFRAAKPQKESK
ncbi:MAG: copper-binding protein [Acidobacteriota bacterium]